MTDLACDRSPGLGYTPWQEYDTSPQCEVLPEKDEMLDSMFLTWFMSIRRNSRVSKLI